MTKFSIIGVGGYIGYRHLQALKDNSVDLLCAYDISDSVGILDAFYPNTDFFIKEIDYKNFILKNNIDYTSICSPNFLHKRHILMSLKMGANVICEKPMVIKPKDLQLIEISEKKYNLSAFCILQLRLHEKIISLKKMINNKQDVFDVDLTYITTRGKWYYSSWKGNVNKSGGILFNIGIHFFDMLIWVFGKVKKIEVHMMNSDTCAGYIELDKARVKWFLSLDEEYLPDTSNNTRTYRSIVINNKVLEFSKGFENLHSKSYSKILSGEGFRIQDVAPAVMLVDKIKKTKVVSGSKNSHSFINKSNGK